MKTFCTLIFLLVVTAACNNKSNYRKAAEEIVANVPPTANMNVGKLNYTVYIPTGWTTTHQTFSGIDYYFLSAPKTIDDPNTNINVITEYMQNLSLDEFKAKTIESVKRAIPSASILAEGDIEANGLKGSWYSYSMEPRNIKATLISYIFPKNGVAYIITAGTQTKDAARYRSTFDSVARSLKFSE